MVARMGRAFERLLLLSMCIGACWPFVACPVQKQHSSSPARLGLITTRNLAPETDSAWDMATTEEFLQHITKLRSAVATHTLGGIEFLRFNQTLLPDDNSSERLSHGISNGTRKGILLYLPGLEFTGLSAAGALPRLLERYDVWWCRAPQAYRGGYAQLADTVVDFLVTQEAQARPVTLLGESFGGLLSIGVARRLLLLQDRASNLNDGDLRANNDEQGGSRQPSGGQVNHLRGLILVNPATSFGQTSWSSLIPWLTSLPTTSFAASLSDVAGFFGGVGRSLSSKGSPGRLSPYSAFGSVVLGLTLLDVTQVTSVVQALLTDATSAAVGHSAGDGSTSGVFSSSPRQLAGRLGQGLEALDDLARRRLDPVTLRFRLDRWLGEGLAELKAHVESGAWKSGGTRTRDEASNGSGFGGVPRGLVELRGRVPALVVAGEEDRVLPSAAEAKILARALGGPSWCRAVVLAGVGHVALADDRADLLGLVDASPLAWRYREQGTAEAAAAASTAAQNSHEEKSPSSNYQRGAVTGFVRPNTTAIAAAVRGLAPLRRLVSPVFLSTDAISGRKRFGLGGVPLPKDVGGRPVLLVGNHQAFGLDLGLLVAQFLSERDALPRGLAHPAVFQDRRSTIEEEVEPELIEDSAGPLSPGPILRRAARVARSLAPPAIRRARGAGARHRGGGGGDLPGGDLPGVPDFAQFGAVPVTPRNFHRLLAAGELVLLFPGGAREAFHGKGEANALFWPSSVVAAGRTDFVRMAAAFDSLIVPFGAVGAADSLAVVADPADLERLAELAAPVLSTFGRQRARPRPLPAARDWAAAGRDPKMNGITDMRPPLAVPSPTGPDRFYFLFGEPLETAELDHRDRARMAATHAEVRRRVEECIAFLLNARTRDSFRSLALRLPFELLNDRDAPSFPLRPNEKGRARMHHSANAQL